MPRFRRALALILLTAGLSAAGVATAAHDYDNCTGFIDALPATLTTQGTWCLRRDLSTAMTYGSAITIAANNITVDCNDFRVGGLAGGRGTFAVGIDADGRLNATVRQCNVRGFHMGIRLGGSPSGGHIVEDNRLDGNTEYGMFVGGDGSIVRRNQVRNTGGSQPSSGQAWGIVTAFNVDVLDNNVFNVFCTPAAGMGSCNITGIETAFSPGGIIRGNRLRILDNPEGRVYAISTLASGRVTIQDNDVIGSGRVGPPGFSGISCLGPDGGLARAKDNIVNGFDYALENCRDDGNSL